jgi:hypothetical protein
MARRGDVYGAALVVGLIAAALCSASDASANSARLTGDWALDGKVTQVKNVRNHHVGQVLHRTYVIEPRCSSGECTVALVRKAGKTTLQPSMTLKRHGRRYTGTVSKKLSCGQRGGSGRLRTAVTIDVASSDGKYAMAIRSAFKQQFDGCDGHTREAATFKGRPKCSRSVSVRKVVAASACFYRDRQTFRSTKPVRVNGIDVDAIGSRFTYVSVNRHAVYTVGPATVGIGPVRIPKKFVLWDVSHAVKLSAEGAKGTIKGLKVFGSAEIGWSAKGATIELEVSLGKEIYRTITDVKNKKLTKRAAGFALKLRSTNAEGVVLDSFRISADNAVLGWRITLKKLELKYTRKDKSGTDDTRKDNLLEGTVAVTLPFAKRKALRDKTFTGSLSFKLGKDVQFRKLGLEISGLNKLVVADPPIFLQKIGAEFGLHPLILGGKAELTLGPEKELLGTKYRLLAANGSLTYTGAPTDELELKGGLELFKQPLADGRARWYFNSGAGDVKGNLDLTLLGYGFEGDIKGAILLGSAFRFTSRGHLRLPGASAEGRELITNKGIAACGAYKLLFASIEVGWTYRYNQKLPRIHGACDFSEIEPTAPTGRRASLHAAAAPVQVSSAQRAVMFEFLGDGGAPKVALTAPGGQRIDTPAALSAAEGSNYLIIQAPEESKTYIIVARPKAGAWTAEGEPGSRAIVAQEVTNALPVSHVRADVRGHGRTRRLAWVLRSIKGQRVSFVEQGAGAAKVLATTNESRGIVRFAPDDGPAGEREIVAYIEQGGAPRTALRVAAFHAPGPLRPERPRRLRARPRRGNLVITWSKAKRAARYEVRVQLRDGAGVVVRQARRRFTLTGVARGGGTVAVLGVDGRGRTGPAAVASIRR